MQEMDISKRAMCKGQVFTDLLFESIEGTESDLHKVNSH